MKFGNYLMPLLSKQSRQNQSLAEIDSLMRELATWYAEATAGDRHDDGSPRGQYKTQLDRVYSEVNGAALLIRKSLRDTSLDRPAPDVYGEFARADREILWLWRVWYYFRDKFQQRQDPRFGPILRAADEVVWSCHRPFFQLPGQIKPTPAPLPYIKADFSPSALRQDQRDALDRQDSDFVVVTEAFAQLPVPILALPITAVNNPWTLVLIGHEAGHIVEPLVDPDFNMTFQAALGKAVEDLQGPEDDQSRWQGWGDEIFADVYSILTMGPWAVWAMSQFEAADGAAMAERRWVYPAPCVRLQLMTAIAKHYGLTTEIPDAPPALPDEVQRDTTYVDGVAAAIVSMPRIQTLAASLPFAISHYLPKDAAGAFGEVEQWNRYLGAARAPAPAGRQLRSARMAAAGAAKAWSETIFAADSPEARDKLCNLAIPGIAAAGPPGVRSALAFAKPPGEAGQSLFQTLRKADQLLKEARASSR
jgi:hypothetical protein